MGRLMASVSIFVAAGILLGGVSAVVKAFTPQGAVTDAVPRLSNLNISNLPFCNVPLKNLVQTVNQYLQTSGNLTSVTSSDFGKLESLYNYLMILYNQRKGDYEKGSSSLDPDQVDYCRFTQLDNQLAKMDIGTIGTGKEEFEIEIPIVYFTARYVVTNYIIYDGYQIYKYLYSGKSYEELKQSFMYDGRIGKMVVSAEGDHALIRSILGAPTNIKIYFNPSDIKVTKANLMALLAGQFSMRFIRTGNLSPFSPVPFNSLTPPPPLSSLVPPPYYTYVDAGVNVSGACILPTSITDSNNIHILYIEPVYVEHSYDHHRPHTPEIGQPGWWYAGFSGRRYDSPKISIRRIECLKYQ